MLERTTAEWRRFEKAGLSAHITVIFACSIKSNETKFLCYIAQRAAGFQLHSWMETCLSKNNRSKMSLLTEKNPLPETPELKNMSFIHCWYSLKRSSFENKTSVRRLLLVQNHCKKRALFATVSMATIEQNEIRLIWAFFRWDISFICPITV